MKILIFGATGMLGQALTYEAFIRNIDTVGIARSGTDICLDILNERALKDIVESIKPQIIINAAAITNLTECEDNPGLAYLINSRAVRILAEMSRKIGAYLIQISTDHYFVGDRDIKHNETSPIRLVNEYARSKYAGEKFALAYPNSLVIRTNIVGFRHNKGQLTFAEWVFSAIENRESIVLFDDFFTSSIDVAQFSVALFNLLDKGLTGVINIASREVFSKKDFIEAIATQLEYKLSNTTTGSVFKMKNIPRAESLGLEVRKAEAYLGYKLPTMNEVVTKLILAYKEQ